MTRCDTRSHAANEGSGQWYGGDDACEGAKTRMRPLACGYPPRLCGPPVLDARAVNYADGVLDDEQHVEPLEENSVDVEQVTRPDALGLRFEELTPTRSGATWHGIEPGSFEDVTRG